MTWSSPLNAEIYDAFTREHGLYPFLNRELVARLDLPTATRLLDLACGTGATARACLRHLPRDASLVGLDASESMVAVARRQVPDPRARFLVSAAEHAAKTLASEPRFDRCACNAAFWQFPAKEAALRAVGELLEAGGSFALNVPAERVATGRAARRRSGRGERDLGRPDELANASRGGEGRGVHSFQAALSRRIVAATGRPLPAPTQLIDLDETERAAAAGGLRLESTERLSYRCAQAELVELMWVPALIGPLVAGLTDEAVEEILADAAGAVDLDEEVELHWLVLSFTATG